MDNTECEKHSASAGFQVLSRLANQRKTNHVRLAQWDDWICPSRLSRQFALHHRSGRKYKPYGFIASRQFAHLGSCDKFTCELRDEVRYSFAMTFVNKQPMRTAVTSGCETLTFLEGDWAECIPPIGTPPIRSYTPMNCKYDLNEFRFRRGPLVIFVCIAWVGASSVPTDILSVRYLGWPNSTH